MITDQELRDRLHAIAEWGRPTTIPPLAESAVVDLERAQSRRRPGPLWLSAAAALLIAVVLVSTMGSPPPPIASGSWTRMAEAPIEPRALAATAWTGTEVVVVGGQRGNGEILRDAAAYDPAANTWRRLPDAPVDVHGGAVALWTGQEVAVFNVESAVVTEMPNGFFGFRLSEPVAVDPATGVWRTLPPPPHFVAAATVVAGRIIALASDGDQPVILELHGDAWRAVARPPARGFDFLMVRGWTAFESGGAALFLAGEWVEPNLDPDTPIGFSWDPLTQTGGAFRQPAFRAKGKTPSIAHMRSAPSAPGRALAIGISNDGENRPAHDAAILDVASQQWRPIDPPSELPLEDDLLRGVTLTSVNGDLVVLGGATTDHIIGNGKGGLHTAFVSESNRWHTLPEPPIDMNRVGHVAVWTGSQLVVWGGLFNRTGTSNRADTPASDGALYDL